MISAEYKQARCGAKAPYYPLQNQIDCFEVDSFEIKASEDVDGWIRPGRWHVLTFHDSGSPGGYSNIPEAEFARQMDELAKRRDSGDVYVVTFKDGADRFRQPK